MFNSTLTYKATLGAVMATLWLIANSAFALEDLPKKAIALLHPTAGNRAQGSVTFTETDGGVLIEADVIYLEPGKHGFHIHEWGDCSAPDGSSIGRHFNPTCQRHGGPDHLERHAGDLGNIVADECGRCHYKRVDKVIKLSGPMSVVGRAIAIHANADDFCSQPFGNSGGIVSCGIID